MMHHKGTVSSLWLGPGGKQMISGSDDGTLAFWRKKV